MKICANWIALKTMDIRLNNVVTMNVEGILNMTNHKFKGANHQSCAVNEQPREVSFEHKISLSNKSLAQKSSEIKM